MQRKGDAFLALFCVVKLKVINQTVKEDFKLCNSAEDSKMSTGPEFRRKNWEPDPNSRISHFLSLDSVSPSTQCSGLTPPHVPVLRKRLKEQLCF